MSKFIIQGGTPLYGSVRVGGAKNASFKIMIAALLADEPSRLLNVPNIADVEFTARIIRALGGGVARRGERMLWVDPASLSGASIDGSGQFSRASTMFLPVLLAKFGHATVPLPGGDKIGKRPLERHFAGLQALGAQLTIQDQQVIATLPQGKFIGNTYRFAKNSHTGTETLLMAAALASGVTVLENAAVEPEVQDLIKFLQAMGAQIRQIRPRVYQIKGVPRLHGAIYQIMPDRNETVSYACAAIATKGDVVVENARAADLTVFLEKLTQIGAGYQLGDFGIRFYYHQPLTATSIQTGIHPGFMTDWQPLWATLVSQAQGESIIHETVSQSRFQYADALRQMGASITLFQPNVADPEQTYNFNLADDDGRTPHALKIAGPAHFTGGEFSVADLRAGATLLLAALAGHGTTVLHRVEQIDRGYEQLDARLRQLGAKIDRID